MHVAYAFSTTIRRFHALLELLSFFVKQICFKSNSRFVERVIDLFNYAKLKYQTRLNIAEIATNFANGEYMRSTFYSVILNRWRYFFSRYSTLVLNKGHFISNLMR